MAFGLGKWDVTVDVVVVGSGIGGLSAAIAAHDRGLKVLVLEKAPKLGGVSAYSGGEVFVPANHVEERDGIADSMRGGTEVPPVPRRRLRRAGAPARPPRHRPRRRALFRGEGRRPVEGRQGLPRLPLPARARHGGRRPLPRDGALRRPGARRLAEAHVPVAAHAQRHHARRALRLGRLRQRDEVGLRRDGQALQAGQARLRPRDDGVLRQGGDDRPRHPRAPRVARPRARRGGRRRRGRPRRAGREGPPRPREAGRGPRRGRLRLEPRGRALVRAPARVAVDGAAERHG